MYSLSGFNKIIIIINCRQSVNSCDSVTLICTVHGVELSVFTVVPVQSRHGKCMHNLIMGFPCVGFPYIIKESRRSMFSFWGDNHLLSDLAE